MFIRHCSRPASVRSARSHPFLAAAFAFFAFVGAPAARAAETQFVTPNLLSVGNGGFSNADDAASLPVPIGFTFTFAGIDYTDVTVSTNGVVYFSNSSSAYSNTSLDMQVGANA